MTDKHFENSVFRILDAAINRAGEGIRVVEDYVRMVLGDAHLSSQLKLLRHDLTASVAAIDPLQRIAARDTLGDVGTKIQTESEYVRDATDPHGRPQSEAVVVPSGGMVQANLGRAQQAFRTIEEFSKSVSGELAKQVEQLRYRTYTLEKAVLTTVVSLKNLTDLHLYVLVDTQGQWQSNIEQLIQAEVGVIQLRDKSLSDRQLVETGRTISSLTRGTSTKFVMNDRADLAVAANADGVHLGQDDVKVSDARRIVGAAKMIGVSTHNIEQARQAVLDGANYIGVGPVFPSQTKQFQAHVGLDLLKEVAQELTLPAFAIGGITLENLGDVLQAGFSRVAVSAAISRADDPAQAALNFEQSLRRT